MGRVALFRAGTAVDGGGRINQEAGLGPGCPGLAWSLSREQAHQTAAPGRDCWEDGQALTRGNCCLPCLGPECLCVHTAHLACCSLTHTLWYLRGQGQSQVYREGLWALESDPGGEPSCHWIVPL